MQTVSQHNEKKLSQKTKDAYWEVINRLPLPVYICDAEGYIESYNDAAVDLWGRKPVEGKELWCDLVKIFCSEGRPLPIDEWPMNIALKEGRSVNMEIIIERHDGTRRSVIPHPQAIYGPEGSIVGAVNTLIDITPQSEILKKARENERKGLFVADTIPHKIWAAEPNGETTYFNKQWLSYTGLTEEQILDWEKYPIIHPDDVAEIIRKWNLAVAKGESWGAEVRFKDKEGIYKWHQTNCIPHKNEEGKIVMWIGTSTEIQTRKMEKDELEKAVADRTRELKKVNTKLLNIIQTHEYAEEVGKFGSYRYNINTRKIKYSDNFYRLLGCEPNEFPPGAEHFMKYVHPDDVKYLLNAQREAVEERKMSTWVYRLIRKDGKIIYVRGTGKFIRNRRNVNLMIGTLQDITVEKEQEEKILQANLILESQNEVLVESEERFLKIFDHNPVAMTLSELKTKKIVYANTRFYKTFGYAKEEIIGRSSDEINFVSLEESQRLTSLLLEHLKEERSVEELKAMSIEEVEQMLIKIKESGFMNGIEVLYTKKNGETFYGMVSYEIIRIGNESYTITSCQDITDRKKAEERLKKSEEQYQRIVNEVKDYAIVSLNREGIIENWNEGAKKIKGYQSEEIIGKFFGVFYLEEDCKNRFPERLLEEAVKKGKATHEGYRIRKDGTVFFANVVITALHDQQGNVTGFSKITRDLTAQKRKDDELKNAYDQLKKQNDELWKMNRDLQKQKQAKDDAELKKRIAEQAVKSKQQFLANMSHEIRTPMNSIIGFTNVMLKSDLSPEQKDHINAIKMSGEALLVIINDILDLAKVDSGRMVFEKIPFNLKNSISGTIHLMDGKVKEKNLELVREYDLSVPEMVVGDPVRLRQITLNLLSNAVKFTEEGKITTRITVVKQTEKKVSIEFAVIDTGIGIPQDKQDHIFDSFEQASCNTSRIYGGTGLGLAIAKKFVELQGGTIKVKSKVGKGSTFSFVLDFEKTKQEVDPESMEMKPIHKNLRNNSLKKVKILVVEDVFLNQLLVKIMLTDFGFDFEIVENGRIAIEKLKENHYDIILMDLQMPEMNGFEATNRIRQELRLQVPIIALTADVTTTDLDKSQAAGMDDYIPKPIDDRLLYRKIMKHLRKMNIVDADGQAE